ncbi:hypothetical protein WME76_06180 [Sorangium sp. So ce119]|uniref:hypothetical protein n=1 Tax=Sorangium sp. So ce119 TaxID=3133279 RepID=UPI003F5F475E
MMCASVAAITRYSLARSIDSERMIFRYSRYFSVTKLTGMSRMSSSCCWMRWSSRSSGPSNVGSETTYSPSRGPASAASPAAVDASATSRGGVGASRAREAAAPREAGAGAAPALPRPLPPRALAAPALEPLTRRP